jgi:5-methyltetrahydropteroyltriglutamate--homocysteine methyltransferase
MQRVFDKTSYADALAVYLDRINCDVLTLEMKDRGFAEIELLGAWKGKTRKKFAIGVVSHRTLNAETPDEVAHDIRLALKYVDVENLLITSDCGFGRQGANRLVAFYKTAAAALGANVVRREYGLSETYVPCADRQLIQDVVPTRYEDEVQPTPAAVAPPSITNGQQHRGQPQSTAAASYPGRPGQAQRLSDHLKQGR